MTHLFRPAEPSDGRRFPQARMWRGLVVVAALSLLARGRGLFHWLHQHGVLHTALMLVGLVVQGALLLTAAYLIDLAVSLMELWAELARQHLRLTL